HHNSLPEVMIDGFEVLETVAASIYGSDAISGVVNIITRTRQNGLNVSGQLGEVGNGDGFATNEQLSYGWASADGGTSIVAGVNYSRQDEVSSGERSISLF